MMPSRQRSTKKWGRPHDLPTERSSRERTEIFGALPPCRWSAQKHSSAGSRSLGHDPTGQHLQGIDLVAREGIEVEKLAHLDREQFPGDHLLQHTSLSSENDWFLMVDFRA